MGDTVLSAGQTNAPENRLPGVYEDDEQRQRLEDASAKVEKREPEDVERVFKDQDKLEEETEFAGKQAEAAVEAAKNAPDTDVYADGSDDDDDDNADQLDYDDEDDEANKNPDYKP